MLGEVSSQKTHFDSIDSCTILSEGTFIFLAQIVNKFEYLHKSLTLLDVPALSWTHWCPHCDAI